VYIEGRIETREWQDKEGQKRYSTEIIANEMKMLGSKSDSGGSGGSYGTPRSTEHEPAGGGEDAGGHAGPEISDEDIPF
jgi:single-strand DNA-binding protein